MSVGAIQDEGDLERFLQAMLDRQGIRPPRASIQRVLLAELPAAAPEYEGQQVYIPDAAAGQKWRGCNGTTWDILG